MYCASGSNGGIVGFSCCLLVTEASIHLWLMNLSVIWGFGYLNGLLTAQFKVPYAFIFLLFIGTRLVLGILVVRGCC